MEDITNEVMAAITTHKEQLMKLLASQDALTAELKALEARFDTGRVSQAELDRRLEILVPKHDRQQQEIALAFAEIERLRKKIFDETGFELPPFV